MAKYHAVMLDETRCEFRVSFEAPSRQAAYEYLEEEYPESQVDELTDETQRLAREQARQAYLNKCYDDPYYEIDHPNEWY